MNTIVIKSGQAQTNESKIRLIAFFVCGLIIIYCIWRPVFIPAFLTLDFTLRSFDLAKFSPLALISEWLVQKFKLQVKLVYLPPKRFAARIGLAFSVALLLLGFFKINSFIVSGMLAFFAALEAFLGICAGCYVYSFFQRFKS